MSLQLRLEALARGVGTDIKTVSARLDALEAAGGGAGSTGTTASGYRPTDYGFNVWSMDPMATTAGQVLTTAGTMYGTRLFTPVDISISAVYMHVFTAGATLTTGSNKAAVYDEFGSLLGTSVDQASAWMSTGVKKMMLTSTIIVPAGWFDIGVWRVGSTSPSFTRGISAAVLLNYNQIGQNLRSWSANTGLTTTAPATLGTKSNGLGALWAAA